MAITIRQNADTPNLANNRLVYAVTSNSSSEAQYRYVLDILDKDDTLLQRIKQQPNPNDTGIFDIGQIINTYVGPTDRVWDISEATENTNVGKDFKIRFGEEYAASATGSATLYTGGSELQAGAPSVSSSAYNFIFDGVWNPMQGDEYDWDYATKYDEEDTYGSTTFNHQNGLTLFDSSKVRLGDYHTLSLLNGNARGLASGDVDPGLAQDVYAMVVKQYDSSDVQLSVDTIYNLTLRTASTDLWDDVYTNQTENTRITHFPVGPQNLEDAGITLDSSLSYYVITFHSQTPEPGVNDSGVFGTYTFTVEDQACDFPGTRFAWKNQYGVWDYFNFSLAEARTSNIERNSFEASFVDFSSTNTSPYDHERRGMTQFHNKVTKNRTAESDYLSQTEADNLRELFYSTDVYIQQSNGEFWPIVITNASVTEKTNPRSQKLFRFTAEYQYANKIQDRV